MTFFYYKFCRWGETNDSASGACDSTEVGQTRANVVFLFNCVKVVDFFGQFMKKKLILLLKQSNRIEQKRLT